MPSVNDLLKTSGSSFKAPPRFPAGNYIVAIQSYELLPFVWKTSGVHGLAYVPTIRCVSSVEADDDSNPELQKEQQEALDKYGNWTDKDFHFQYTDKETSEKRATVSEINFPLIETDEDGDAVGILEKHAWRFFMREDDGTETGFVVDVLGMTDLAEKELGEIMEDTVGKQFMVQFDYEPNQDPSRPPNFVISSVTCLA